MERKAVKIDAASVARATFVAKRWRDDTLKTAQKLDCDSEAKQRLSEQLCETCYYLRKGGLAGAAVTQQPCGICHDLQTYGSTATHTLCMKCAKKYELCKRCGADIGFRERPKFTGASDNG